MTEGALSLPVALAEFAKPHRYKIAYGGRGSAKSWSFARMLIARAYEKKTRVLCAREIQRTISESVHQLLKDQIEFLGLTWAFQVTDNVIRCPSTGSEFYFAGLRQQDVVKIKSFEGVDIVWVEEAQVVTKKSWDILIPTIRREGSEIWVSFNPELDTDETYVRFVIDPPEDAVVVKMNYSENPWFPDVLEQERLQLRRRDPEAYDNVWEGNCRAAVEGAIYGKEVIQAIENKRVRPVPVDPLLKVHCIWDLGWNDQMTIIMAQRAASSVMVVDYIEDSHRTYHSYVKELEDRGYRYGKDWLPHDAGHRDPKTGKSHTEVLEELGRRVEIVPNVGVEAGIKLARQMFPQVYFDEDRTQTLFHCLKRYRRQINQTTNEPGGPLHDAYSHGADAFRYLAVIAEQMTNDDTPKGDPYAGFRTHEMIV